jgi:hypothetical protein
MVKKDAKMGLITAESLMSLEQYAKARKGYRERVLAHKKDRTVQLGEHVTLVFEDELTMRYQIQEMLRVERIFEEKGIRDELDAYNPLVPDGSNWKATMLIEYPELEERRLALGNLIGVEDRVWVKAEKQQTRTSTAKMTTRPRLFIFCASNSQCQQKRH